MSVKTNFFKWRWSFWSH